MFAGTARRRGNCRVITVANAATRIALKGDDPDFIVLEVINGSFGGTIVTLPNSAPIGKTFTFILAAHPLIAINVSALAVTIAVPGNRALTWLLQAGQEPRFIYTPNGWLTPRGAATGSGADGDTTAIGLAFGSGAIGSYGSVAIGFNANAANFGSGGGVAIGNSSSSPAGGVAIGFSAAAANSGDSVAIGASAIGSSGVAVGGAASTGSSNSVAVGISAAANDNGVAIGPSALSASKSYAVALGYRSTAQRYRELVKSADGATTTLQSFSILDWYGDTTDATPAELLLGGTASQRALLLNSSAFIFKLLVAARNNADDVSSFWELTGGIKRGANAAATAIVGSVTKTITAADAGAATWDIGATADTTNGSLKLTVTGEAAKTIRWNVRGDISELRF
jgi:hypothetical protein